MARKFTANFDKFAQWYIGEQCTSERIIEYFEQELGETVQPFIGKEVVFIERELPNVIEYSIEGTDFVCDAIEQFI